ncbi:hypothetical protein II906_08965 [bacterium]|nr:hypothetical protein [bacterium]
MDIFYIKTEIFNILKKGSEQSALGRYIIEYAAKNHYNIENSELEIINNKPKFKYSDVNFSISHTDGLVAVCFDENPVGFDVEKIKKRNYKAIANRMNFDMKKDSPEEFYRCWCEYEAEYKLQAKQKKVCSQIFLKDYMMSVCTAADKIGELNFYQVNFKKEN